MGSITTGIGLISGIDIAGLIDSLITLESAGKFRLQERLGVLRSQQTALLDVNARLLAFKSAAGGFRTKDIFRTTAAASSDEDSITANATTDASPGSYKFIVKQLVTTSQQITRGYATRNASPLGLDQLSFEFGNGRLARDRALEDLNGGAGVDRGRIIIDDGTDSVTVDLTDVTTINEVLERINGNGELDVTATVADDRLVITSNTGNDITISNRVGDTTATDLGIVGTSVGQVLTGTSVFYLGPDTALSTLNDGNGVLTRDNGLIDFVITTHDGSTIEIDLGRIDEDIDDTTLLSELNDGAGVGIDDDNDTFDIRFVDRDGNAHDVDLSGATTVGQLRTRIANETGGRINLVVEGGDRFKVVDTIGTGGQNLRIEGTDDNGSQVAEDLGILNETGVAANEYVGTVIPSTIDQPAVSTIQEVIDRINNDDQNPLGAKIVASIAPDGQRLQLQDLTIGAGPLVVASTLTNPTAASDLGIETASGGALYTGARIFGSLGTVLTSSLNGGQGLAGATTVTFADRTGLASFDFDNVDTYETVSELIDAINTEAQINGVQITASLNDTGNGLKITDTSGSTAANLIVSSVDDTARLLGIEADVAADAVVGQNVQLQYVSRATKLSDLNYGRGIATGSFRITDGLGDSATVSVTSGMKTVQDLLVAINGQGLEINARINDNGDGIIIEDRDPLASRIVKLKVEGGSGATARDLNIVGEAATVDAGFVDGSYEQVVDLDTSDSLDAVLAKIADSGAPVSASIINTGSGSAPFRLSLTSGITGTAGDLVIDAGGADIGLSVLAAGRDAKVFFGADTPEDGFLLTSSTNTLDGVIEGVTIDLHDTSDDPVTLTITRDESAITGAVNQFVTSFNDVVGRIKEYDFFDTETEERGLLLGNPTAARIRDAMYRVASGRAFNVGGSFQFLSQVGIRFNGEGEMTFDQDAFLAAYQSDPESVEALFAAYEVDTGTSSEEEIVEGVTVQSSDLSFDALGFGSLFDNLLDDLTNSINGVTTLADRGFDSQIELINNRISTIDQRLEARRAQLTREFVAMERALALLQGQSNALGSLAQSVNLAGALGTASTQRR